MEKKMRLSKDKKKSIYLSYILRHTPEEIDITMDSEGYVKIDELLEKLPTKYKLSKDELEQIIQTDDKKRFGYSTDETMIRAEQGHSIDVDIIYDRVYIGKLFHGTAEKSLGSILRDGLKPQTRKYVHLSGDYDTAITVGKRHGKPVIFKVDCKDLEVYISKNGVYLTKFVEPERLSII